MWDHFCISKMGVQICSQTSNLRCSSLVMCVPSFLPDRPKSVLRMIRHFVHVGPLLQLKNWYSNMISYFESEKFTPHYSRSFVFHGFLEKSPKNISSLCASGAMSTTPKLVSKYDPIFHIQEFAPCFVCSFILTRSCENTPKNDSSLRPCGVNFATQKWVSKILVKLIK